MTNHPTLPGARVTSELSPGPETQAKSERTPVTDRMSGLLGVLLPVLTFAGAATYVVLRLVYVQFYDRFGARPEDVGMGRAEILSQALVGPAAILLGIAGLFGLWMFFVFIAGSFLQRAVEKLVRRKPAAKKSRRSRWRAATGVAILSGAGYGMFIVGILLFGDARSAGDRARSGIVVRDLALDFGFVRIPYLDIRAEPVRIASATGGAVPRALRGERSRCLLYLGAANGTALLYDVARRTVVRVSTSTAVLETPRGQHALPQDCRPVETRDFVPVSSDRTARNINALGHHRVWSHRIAARKYRLWHSTRRLVSTAPIPPSTRAIDADLGDGPGGRPAAVYRRCSPRCAMYVLDLARGRETEVAVPRQRRCVAGRPAVWRRRIVFTVRGSRCPRERAGLWLVERGKEARRLRGSAASFVGSAALRARLSEVDIVGDDVLWIDQDGLLARVHLLSLGDGRHEVLYHDNAGAHVRRFAVTSPVIAEGAAYFAVEHAGDSPYRRIVRVDLERGKPCVASEDEFPGRGALGAGGMTATGIDMTVDLLGTVLFVSEEGVLRTDGPARFDADATSPPSRSIGRRAACRWS